MEFVSSFNDSCFRIISESRLDSTFLFVLGYVAVDADIEFDCYPCESSPSV
jgi:hypothetical protein